MLQPSFLRSFFYFVFYILWYIVRASLWIWFTNVYIKFDPYYWSPVHALKIALFLKQFVAHSCNPSLWVFSSYTRWWEVCLPNLVWFVFSLLLDIDSRSADIWDPRASNSFFCINIPGVRYFSRLCCVFPFWDITVVSKLLSWNSLCFHWRA